MMKKKSIALSLALVLLVVGAVGGTLAWLLDTTESIENKFTPSDITIDLDESEDLNLKMIPGWTITKDPVVTVAQGSEACWLFVKIEKSSNFDTFMQFEIADGWKKLENDQDNNTLTDVYYRDVAATTDQAAGPFTVIKNNQVKVKDTVTKENMNELTADTYPTLTFTAYAAQYYSSNTTTPEIMAVDVAWSNVKENPATPAIQ